MDNFDRNKQLKAILSFWLLSNAEAALQHCSTTKTTKMSSSLFYSKDFILGDHKS